MNLINRLSGKYFQLVRNWSQRSRRKENQTLQDKIQQSRDNLSNLVYNNKPKVSIIVQFFNKRNNIKGLIDRLRKSGAEEIIVIDDGSIDGSYEDWISHLNRPNDFLLRCNDLFEVRTYDRAMRMAKGEFVCLLQDDDLPPPNNKWIEQALSLFTIFPDLIMLGGRDGLDIMIPDPVTSSQPQEYQRVGNIVQCPGLHKVQVYNTPFYREPTSNLPFMFTMAVNRAPTFLRRKEFLEIGGINQNYAPFQFDDDEAGIRAWLAGYKVGLYSCSFVRELDIGGMALFNKDKIKEQALVNIKKLYDEYSEAIANGYLQNLVDSANRVLTPSE